MHANVSNIVLCKSSKDYAQLFTNEIQFMHWKLEVEQKNKNEYDLPKKKQNIITITKKEKK